MPASSFRAQQEQIRELQRLLGGRNIRRAARRDLHKVARGLKRAGRIVDGRRERNGVVRVNGHLIRAARGLIHRVDGE